jgi:hypothetical protein
LQGISLTAGPCAATAIPHRKAEKRKEGKRRRERVSRSSTVSHGFEGVDKAGAHLWQQRRREEGRIAAWSMQVGGGREKVGRAQWRVRRLVGLWGNCLYCTGLRTASLLLFVCVKKFLGGGTSINQSTCGSSDLNGEIANLFSLFLIDSFFLNLSFVWFPFDVFSFLDHDSYLSFFKSRCIP